MGTTNVFPPSKALYKLLGGPFACSREIQRLNAGFWWSQCQVFRGEKKGKVRQSQHNKQPPTPHVTLSLLYLLVNGCNSHGFVRYATTPYHYHRLDVYCFGRTDSILRKWQGLLTTIHRDILFGPRAVELLLLTVPPFSGVAPLVKPVLDDP